MNHIRLLPEIGSKEDPSEPIRFIASTEGKKQDGKDLKADRWILTRFNKNRGPILYSHDYSGKTMPLGHGEAFISDRKLIIDTFFDIDDSFALTVRAKVRKGLMGGSVGWTETSAGNILNEFSICNLPLDENAYPIPREQLETLVRLWNEKSNGSDNRISTDNNHPQSFDELRMWINLVMPLVRNGTYKPEDGILADEIINYFGEKRAERANSLFYFGEFGWKQL